MHISIKNKLTIICTIIIWFSIISIGVYLFEYSFYSRLLYPWSIPVELNSSLNLILFCILLQFTFNRKNPFFIKYCSILIFLNGLFNLLYIAHLNLDLRVLDSMFDNTLLANLIISKSNSGLTCVASNISYTLVGLSFLGISSKNIICNKITQLTLHLVTLISILALLGLLDHVPSLEQLFFFRNFSIYAAFMLMLVSIMAAAMQPHLGFAATFMGSKIGHKNSRSMFPKILISVLFLGYLRILIAKSTTLTEASANVLLQTSFILICLFVIYYTKKSLNIIDDQRKEAECKIILANSNLEKIILERTHYLSQQNKKLEEFAFIVSHNFRAPVSNLQSLVTIYKEEKDILIQDQLLTMFEVSINRLDATLNDLLTGISVKNNSTKENQKVVLRNCFENVVKTLQGDIIKHTAQITTDFSKATSIDYSVLYLESIFQNLLSNALKYSSPLRTPKIHFESLIINDKVVLTISDNGLGIDLKEHGTEIFGFAKVFHKHHDAKGVGLFLIKAQIEGMGGTIKVESTVDIGTKFEIIF